MSKKWCSTCKKLKYFNEFGEDSSNPTGLKSRCLICEQKDNKSWRDRNKDKVKEYEKQYAQKRKEQGNPIVHKRSPNYLINAKKYRDSHRVERAKKIRLDRQNKPDYYKEINKRSYHKNKELRRKNSKAAYRANAEERKQKANNYRKENIDKVLKWNRERRIKKSNIPGNHTLEQWQQLCSFFDGTCPRCGEKKKLTVDHIIPINQSESTDFITNIQPLCKHCNSSKHDTEVIDYRPECVRTWAQEQMNLCQQ